MDAWLCISYICVGPHSTVARIKEAMRLARYAVCVLARFFFRSFFLFSLPFSGGPLEKYICAGNHDLRDTFLCTSISAIWVLSLYLSRSAYLFAPAARVPHHLASRIASRSDARTKCHRQQNTGLTEQSLV